MRDTAEVYPWDQASPGNTCIEVGLGRLLRGEVSSSNQRHLVAILLDLQTFYDCMAVRSRPTRADGIWSQKIKCHKGHHPRQRDFRCPLATMMARVYLGPVLQEVPPEGFKRGARW